MDIETTGRNPATDRVVVIAVSDGTEAYAVDVRFHDRPGSEIDVAGWLRTEVYNRTVVAHNAQFDLAFLKTAYGVEYPNSIWDTMLAEKMIYAGLPYGNGLDDLVKRYFDIEMDKTLQTSFLPENGFDYETSEITPEQAEYAASDTRLLLEIAERQRREISKRGQGRVWTDIERKVLPVFTEMYRLGIYVDTDRLMPLLEVARAKAIDIENRLVEILTPHLYGKRIADRDAMQAELDEYLAREAAEIDRLREFWKGFIEVLPADQPGFELPQVWIENKWDDLKVPKGKEEPAGCSRYVRHHMKLWRQENKRPTKPKLVVDPINLSSGKDQVLPALRDMGLPLADFKGETLKVAEAETGDPEMRKILADLREYKDVKKLDSSFGDRLIERRDAEGAVHGNFNQLGAGTGRPTCSAPNMLQMPNEPEFRACFRARPGYKLVVCDYSQMELRLMAQHAKDDRMIDAFIKDIDLHKLLAAEIFTNGDLDAVQKPERSVGKTVNFLIQYGGGAATLQQNLVPLGRYVSVEEAKGYINTWKETFDEANYYREKLGQEARRNGYSETFFGRKRFFDFHGLAFRDQHKLMRQAANHPIQGGNADVTKIAMAEIHRLLYPVGRVLLNIYDEIVTEVEEEYAEEAFHIIRAAMTAAAELVLTDVPVKVDAVISPSWSEEEGYQPGEE